MFICILQKYCSIFVTVYLLEKKKQAKILTTEGALSTRLKNKIENNST